MVEIINLFNSHAVCPLGLGIPCEDMIKVEIVRKLILIPVTVFILLSKYVISVLYKLQIHPYAKS